ncbi:aldo/keto reductase [Neisseriaceae bacterium TC5R-5]|nr:aldo/keto reductase [Neisseriaceae bacterium TC5R-5]
MTTHFALSPSYQIPRVIIGSWQLSSGHALQADIDYQAALAAFSFLADHGLNTIDCADIYTGAESLIGEFIQQRRQQSGRDDIRVHTKFVPDIDRLGQIKRQDVRAIITRSLQRLNKSALDLVQFHWWDYAVEHFIEVAFYLQELKDEGLILQLGTTNFDTPHLQQLLAAGIPIISNQTQYSLLDQRPARQMTALCAEYPLNLICYGSLAGGFLSEKWLGLSAPPATLDNRSLVKYALVIEDSLGWDAYQQLLQRLKQLADARQCQIANIASAYVLHKKAVASVIVGVRTPAHIESTVRTLDIVLSPQEIQELDTFLGHYPGLVGEPFALERELGNKHRNIMKMNLSES